jgi:hypothetical protein
LRRRNRLQNLLNLFVILLALGAMLGSGYSALLGQEIGDIFYSSTFSTIMALLPFIIFFVAGCYFWYLCRRAVPATNCIVRDPIMRKIDNNIIRKAQSRG